MKRNARKTQVGSYTRNGRKVSAYQANRYHSETPFLDGVITCSRIAGKLLFFLAREVARFARAGAAAAQSWNEQPSTPAVKVTSAAQLLEVAERYPHPTDPLEISPEFAEAVQEYLAAQGWAAELKQAIADGRSDNIEGVELIEPGEQVLYVPLVANELDDDDEPLAFDDPAWDDDVDAIWWPAGMTDEQVRAALIERAAVTGEHLVVDEETGELVGTRPAPRDRFAELSADERQTVEELNRKFLGGEQS